MSSLAKQKNLLRRSKRANHGRKPTEGRPDSAFKRLKLKK